MPRKKSLSRQFLLSRKAIKREEQNTGTNFSSRKNNKSKKEKMARKGLDENHTCSQIASHQTRDTPKPEKVPDKNS